MEDLIESLTRGNVTEVKVVLATVVLAVLVAAACIGFYGFEEGGAHAVFGCLVLAALALKVLAVRVGGSSSPLLPWLGAALFVLFTATWLTSAGDFLGVG